MINQSRDAAAEQIVGRTEMMNRIDPEIPEGLEFFRRLQAGVVGPCVASTDCFLEGDSRTSRVVDRLGTVLSLVDRLSSCFWGCHLETT